MILRARFLRPPNKLPQGYILLTEEKAVSDTSIPHIQIRPAAYADIANVPPGFIRVGWRSVAIVARLAAKCESFTSSHASGRTRTL